MSETNANPPYMHCLNYKERSSSIKRILMFRGNKRRTLTACIAVLTSIYGNIQNETFTSFLKVKGAYSIVLQSVLMQRTKRAPRKRHFTIIFQATVCSSSFSKGLYREPLPINPMSLSTRLRLL